MPNPNQTQPEELDNSNPAFNRAIGESSFARWKTYKNKGLIPHNAPSLLYFYKPSGQKMLSAPMVTNDEGVRVAYPHSYWDDPQKVVRLHDVLESSPPDWKAPDWLNVEGVKNLYDYLSYRNEGKEPEDWARLDPEDPGYDLVRYLEQPPMEYLHKDDQTPMYQAYRALRDWNAERLAAEQKYQELISNNQSAEADMLNQSYLQQANARWNEMEPWQQVLLSRDSMTQMQGRPEGSYTAAGIYSGIKTTIGVFGISSMVLGGLGLAATAGATTAIAGIPVAAIAAALGIGAGGYSVYKALRGEENELAKILNVFNLPAEATEKLIGTISLVDELSRKGMSPEDVGGLGNIWKAAGMTYETETTLGIGNWEANMISAIAHVLNPKWSSGETADIGAGEVWKFEQGFVTPQLAMEGVLAGDALYESSLRLSQGEEVTDVYEDMIRRFGYTGTRSDFITQNFLDPAQAIPYVVNRGIASYAGKTGNQTLQNSMDNTKGSLLVDMMPMGYQQLVTTISGKRLKGTSGIFDSMESYKFQLQDAVLQTNLKGLQPANYSKFQIWLADLKKTDDGRYVLAALEPNAKPSKQKRTLLNLMGAYTQLDNESKAGMFLENLITNMPRIFDLAEMEPERVIGFMRKVIDNDKIEFVDEAKTRVLIKKLTPELAHAAGISENAVSAFINNGLYDSLFETIKKNKNVNDPIVMKYQQDLIDGTLTAKSLRSTYGPGTSTVGEYGKAILNSPRMQSMNGLFKDFVDSPKTKGALSSYKSQKANRQLLVDLARAATKDYDNPVKPGIVLEMLQAGKVAELFNMIKDNSGHAFDPVTRKYQQMIDAGTLTPGRLTKRMDALISERVPWNDGLMVARLNNMLTDTAKEYVKTRYSLEDSPFVNRLASLNKSVQSLALLGLSPNFLVNNEVNNIVTLVNEGIYSLMTERQAMKVFEDYGVQIPARLQEGFGPSTMIASIFADVQSKDFLAQIQRVSSWTGKKLGIFSSISDRLEQLESVKATATGYLEYMVSSRNTRIPVMDLELQEAIVKAGGNPRELMDIIRDAKTNADIDGIRTANVNRDSVRFSSAFDEAGRILYGDDEVGRSLTNELAKSFLDGRYNDLLSMGYSTPDALAILKNQMDNAITSRVTEDMLARIESIENIQTIEGAKAVTTIFGELEAEEAITNASIRALMEEGMEEVAWLQKHEQWDDRRDVWAAHIQESREQGALSHEKRIVSVAPVIKHYLPETGVGADAILALTDIQKLKDTHNDARDAMYAYAFANLVDAKKSGNADAIKLAEDAFPNVRLELNDLTKKTRATELKLWETYYRAIVEIAGTNAETRKYVKAWTDGMNEIRKQLWAADDAVYAKAAKTKFKDSNARMKLFRDHLQQKVRPLANKMAILSSEGPKIFKDIADEALAEQQRQAVQDVEEATMAGVSTEVREDIENTVAGQGVPPLRTEPVVETEAPITEAVPPETPPASAPAKEPTLDADQKMVQASIQQALTVLEADKVLYDRYTLNGFKREETIMMEKFRKMFHLNDEEVALTKAWIHTKAQYWAFRHGKSPVEWYRRFDLDTVENGILRGDSFSQQIDLVNRQNREAAQIVLETRRNREARDANRPAPPEWEDQGDSKLMDPMSKRYQIATRHPELDTTNKIKAYYPEVNYTAQWYATEKYNKVSADGTQVDIYRNIKNMTFRWWKKRKPGEVIVLHDITGPSGSGAAKFVVRLASEPVISNNNTEVRIKADILPYDELPDPDVIGYRNKIAESAGEDVIDFGDTTAGRKAVVPPEPEWPEDNIPADTTGGNPDMPYGSRDAMIDRMLSLSKEGTPRSYFDKYTDDELRRQVAYYDPKEIGKDSMLLNDDIDVGEEQRIADTIASLSAQKKAASETVNTPTRKILGGFENKGKGTSEGDGKDKAMREVAGYVVTEIKDKTKKSSSQTSQDYITSRWKEGDPNRPKVVMLARNSEYSGQPLKPKTQSLIAQYVKQGYEFVVGDMPGVDSEFIKLLDALGATYTVYHTGDTNRLGLNPTSKTDTGMAETLEMRGITPSGSKAVSWMERRAVTKFDQYGKIIMRATEKADFKSMLHELMHVLMYDLEDDDIDVLAKYGGLSGGNEYLDLRYKRDSSKLSGKEMATLRGAEEKIVSDAIRYWESDEIVPNAPKGISAIFMRMRAWLVSLFKSLKKEAPQIVLKPEVQKAYNNLIFGYETDRIRYDNMVRMKMENPLSSTNSSDIRVRLASGEILPARYVYIPYNNLESRYHMEYSNKTHDISIVDIRARQEYAEAYKARQRDLASIADEADRRFAEDYNLSSAAFPLPPEVAAVRDADIARRSWETQKQLPEAELVKNAEDAFDVLQEYYSGRPKDLLDPLAKQVEEIAKYKRSYESTKSYLEKFQSVDAKTKKQYAAYKKSMQEAYDKYQALLADLKYDTINVAALKRKLMDRKTAVNKDALASYVAKKPELTAAAKRLRELETIYDNARRSFQEAYRSETDRLGTSIVEAISPEFADDLSGKSKIIIVNPAGQILWDPGNIYYNWFNNRRVGTAGMVNELGAAENPVLDQMTWTKQNASRYGIPEAQIAKEDGVIALMLDVDAKQEEIHSLEGLLEIYKITSGQGLLKDLVADLTSAVKAGSNPVLDAYVKRIEQALNTLKYDDPLLGGWRKISEGAAMKEEIMSALNREFATGIYNTPPGVLQILAYTLNNVERPNAIQYMVSNWVKDAAQKIYDDIHAQKTAKAHLKNGQLVRVETNVVNGKKVTTTIPVTDRQGNLFGVDWNDVMLQLDKQIANRFADKKWLSKDGYLKEVVSLTEGNDNLTKLLHTPAGGWQNAKVRGTIKKTADQYLLQHHKYLDNQAIANGSVKPQMLEWDNDSTKEHTFNGRKLEPFDIRKTMYNPRNAEFTGTNDPGSNLKGKNPYKGKTIQQVFDSLPKAKQTAAKLEELYGLWFKDDPKRLSDLQHSLGISYLLDTEAADGLLNAARIITNVANSKFRLSQKLDYQRSKEAYFVNRSPELQKLLKDPEFSEAGLTLAIKEIKDGNYNPDIDTADPSQVWKVNVQREIIKLAIYDNANVDHIRLEFRLATKDNISVALTLIQKEINQFDSDITQYGLYGRVSELKGEISAIRDRIEHVNMRLKTSYSIGMIDKKLFDTQTQHLKSLSKRVTIMDKRMKAILGGPLTKKTKGGETERTVLPREAYNEYVNSGTIPDEALANADTPVPTGEPLPAEDVDLLENTKNLADNSPRAAYLNPTELEAFYQDHSWADSVRLITAEALSRKDPNNPIAQLFYGNTDDAYTSQFSKALYTTFRGWRRALDEWRKSSKYSMDDTGHIPAFLTRHPELLEAMNTNLSNKADWNDHGPSEINRVLGIFMNYEDKLRNRTIKRIANPDNPLEANLLVAAALEVGMNPNRKAADRMSKKVRQYAQEVYEAHRETSVSEEVEVTEEVAQMNNPTGVTPVPLQMSDALRELYNFDLRPVMETAARIMKESPSEYKLDYLNRLPDKDKILLDNWIEKSKALLSQTKDQAVLYATMKRDSALLNYRQRSGFDSMLELFFPYQFWFTRSARNWAKRMISKPALAGRYVRRQEMMRRNGKYYGNLPKRLQGKMVIPWAFSQDWMGSALYINPWRQLFPPSQLLQPFNMFNMQASNVNPEYVLRDWVETKEITEAELKKAMADTESELYQKAYKQAMQDAAEEMSNPATMAGIMMSPSLLFTEVISDPDEPKENLPSTNTGMAIRSFGERLGGGWANALDGLGSLFELPEKALRRNNFTYYGRWGEYLLRRELAAMVGDGTISYQEALTAMLDEEGPFYKQAQQRLESELAMKVAGSALADTIAAKEWSQIPLAMVATLFPGSIFPSGELEMAGLKEEMDSAWAEMGRGNPLPVQKFFDEHPEYLARTAINDPPELMLKKFLVNQIMEQYKAMDPINKGLVKQQLGEEFVDAMLSGEGVDYDNLSEQDLAIWGNAMGAVLPKAAQEQPIKQIELKTFTPEQAKEVTDYISLRERYYPTHTQLQQRYFALDESQQKAFLKQHPELKAYWNWNKKYKDSHPIIAEWANYYQSQSGQTAEGASPYYGVDWNAVQHYQNEMMRLFPGYKSLQDTYFALSENNRYRFLKDNPMLKDAWDWSKKYQEEHPEIKYYKAVQDMVYAAQDAGVSYEAQGQTPAQISEMIDAMPLHSFTKQELLNRYVTGEELSAGAKADIKVLWESLGRPGKSLEDFIDTLY